MYVCVSYLFSVSLKSINCSCLELGLILFTIQNVWLNFQNIKTRALCVAPVWQHCPRSSISLWIWVNFIIHFFIMVVQSSVIECMECSFKCFIVHFCQFVWYLSLSLWSLFILFCHLFIRTLPLNSLYGTSRPLNANRSVVGQSLSVHSIRSQSSPTSRCASSLSSASNLVSHPTQSTLLGSDKLTRFRALRQ